MLRVVGGTSAMFCVCQCVGAGRRPVVAWAGRVPCWRVLCVFGVVRCVFVVVLCANNQCWRPAVVK